MGNNLMKDGIVVAKEYACLEGNGQDDRQTK